MKLAIKSDTRIEIQPEDDLDGCLLRNGTWEVSIEARKPFEFGPDKLVLERRAAEADPGDDGA